MKRQDYISWDEYFMGIALLSAMRSKDNNSQVGACIVSPATTACPSAAMTTICLGSAKAATLTQNICMSATRS